MQVSTRAAHRLKAFNHLCRLARPWVSLGCLSTLLWLGASVQAATLQIATGELPPYATQSRPDQGIALHIVRRAFELSGHEVG